MTSGTASTLRVSRMHYPVTALGPGRRFGVWLQGCPLACAGCMSHDTWDPNGGMAVGIGQVEEAWRDAVAAGADGMTISGGEPLAQAAALTTLLRRTSATRTSMSGEHDVLLYTGFELDELDEEQLGAASLADVVVTGRYRTGEPTGLVWRGSANQRMHLNTDLGRRRYTPYVDCAPDRPSLQLLPVHNGFWLIGIPRRDTLRNLERSLRADGLSLNTVTWRNAARNADQLPSDHEANR